MKDFYFDDRSWAVRYIVADTGSWLAGRLVLISPHAFGSFREDGHALLVNMTRAQIESSPAIEAHKPVSRQLEDQYHRYYGWPSYWEGTGLWSPGGAPVLPPPDEAAAQEEDPHLQSAEAVRGFQLQTDEGAIGHVTDFMIDDQSWTIQQVVAQTGHWFGGKQVVIAPSAISGLSYEDSTVFVTMTKDAIREAPEYHMPPVAYHDAANFDA